MWQVHYHEGDGVEHNKSKACKLQDFYVGKFSDDLIGAKDTTMRNHAESC